MFKRILAAALLAVLLLGLFAGCGSKAEQPAQTDASQKDTELAEPPEEAKTLKILTLGHSLAVDCGHMLALIAKTEGYENLEVGTLYYSGCRLTQHVEFMENDLPEYDLYLSSTETYNTPPKIMEGITMRQAVTYDYWDVIIMQGGAFEIAEDDAYKNGNIQKIQEFVNANKLNPIAVFAWHMPWALPTDNSLRDTYPNENNVYYTNYKPYGDDRSVLFSTITECVQNNIITDETFEFVIPSGTAIENALTSYMGEQDLHRDYAHATDLGRVIASYVWYCKLADVEQLEKIKLDAIPKAFFKSTVAREDRVLTDAEQALILESVNNALKDPFKVTQSQYTEAPDV